MGAGASAATWGTAVHEVAQALVRYPPSVRRRVLDAASLDDVLSDLVHAYQNIPDTGRSAATRPEGAECPLRPHKALCC